MADKYIVEMIKEALAATDNQSADEWFAEMEAAGILDAEGNVLRRMPEPPDDGKANGQAASSRRPRRRKQSATRPPNKKTKAP